MSGVYRMFSGSLRSTSKYPNTCVLDMPTAALATAKRLVGSVGQSAQPSYWRITSVPWYGESAGRGVADWPPKLFSGLPIDTQDRLDGSGAEAGAAAHRRSAA